MPQNGRNRPGKLGEDFRRASSLPIESLAAFAPKLAQFGIVGIVTKLAQLAQRRAASL